MKENELMIGDWVKTQPGGIQRVLGLEVGHVIVKGISVVEDCVEPIPLTAEILEKNGFSNEYCNEDYDLSYAADFAGDVIGVHINGDGGLMDEMYIKTVHELQHALRLCGIDKEIVL